jgi:hypothetical protein
MEKSTSRMIDAKNRMSCCYYATASSFTLQAQIGCPRGLIDDSGLLKPFSTGLERNAILEVVELFKQSESQ